MADIKKELKLVATLDDSAFRKQIEQLKKTLGKEFSFSPQDLGDLKDVFKNIAKDFSNEIKKAFANVKIDGSRIGSGQDSKAKMGELYDDVYKRVIKGEEDILKNKAGQEQRTQREKADRERRSQDEMFRRQRREEEAKKRRDDRLDKSPTAQILKTLGMRPERARGFAQAAEGMLPQSIVGQHGALGQAAKLGRPGIMAGGLLAGGMLGGSLYESIRDIQELSARRQQAQSLDILSGRGLAGAVGQGGRSSIFGALKGGATGALTGAAAGAAFGSVIPGIGTAVGAVGGGLLGGISGALGGGEAEAASRQRRIALAETSLQTARSLRELRIAGMAGGGVTGSRLSIAQQQGAERFGFGPEETLQQFMQARQFLGNSGAAGALGGMQGLQRSLGLGVGEQARAAEIFAGAGGGGMAAGVTQTVEVLKKGVAAGLDASKSGQFLKTTADFVSSQTGFGQLDVGGIADRMSQSAFGFARGGEVTQTNLEQARQLAEMTRQASTSTSGLAGAANFANILDVAQKNKVNLDAFQLQALAKASSEGPAAVSAVLGEAVTGEGSDDLIQKMTADIMQGKKNPLEKANQLLFRDSAKFSQKAFVAEQMGFAKTTEDAKGLFEAMGFQGPRQEGVLPEMARTPELESRIAEASASQKAFAEGLGLLKDDTKAVSDNLKTLTMEIRRAAEAARDFAGSATVSREAK